MSVVVVVVDVCSSADGWTRGKVQELRVIHGNRNSLGPSPYLGGCLCTMRGKYLQECNSV